MAARNRFLAALDPADLALIAPGLTDIELTTGEVLYQPGQRVETVYFPNSALISIVTAMHDGRSVEVSTAGFESVVGTVLALSGAPSHAQVFVQVPG
jgi:CRP-like cAMP-binding protein